MAKKLLFGAALVALSVIGFSGVAAAQAEPDLDALVNEQATGWGLADEGTTSAVGGFSSLGWSIAEADGNIFVGGKFLSVKNWQGTQSRPYFAAFDMATGKWDPSVAPTVGGPVLALETSSEGDLFVGGELKTWNGDTIGGLTKVDTAGNRIGQFRGRVFGAGGFVRDIELADDGWLYVSGNFDKANDNGAVVDVSGVVRFDPTTGALDRSWIPNVPGFQGGIWTVSRSHVNDNVYLGGKVWDLSANPGAVAVSASNASQITWADFFPNRTIFIAAFNRDIPHHIYHIDANEFGRVFVGGTEHGLYVYDESDMSLVINHGTGCNPTVQASCIRTGGDYQDVYQVGSTVFATCHCWGSHTTNTSLIDWLGVPMASKGTYTGPANGVIAYDAVTGVRKQEFNMQAAGDLGGFDVLAASDGCLWVTGGFNAVGEIGSYKSAKDLVRWCGGEPINVGLQPPTSCSAVVTGDTVVVTWNNAVGADKYVVKRTVSGSSKYWRGATDQSSFTDTSRDGELLYFVESVKGVNRSTSASCVTSVEVVEPPVNTGNCSFAVTGNQVKVTWSTVTGATKYVIYRSVNGGKQYWRGAVENGTSFTDSNRDASLEYFVSSVRANGSRSDRVACTSGPAITNVDPVTSCTARVRSKADGSKDIVVVWPLSADASATHVVSRSVDGGKVWWRGLVPAGSSDMADDLRSGSLTYYVQVKVGNKRSVDTKCDPVLDL